MTPPTASSTRRRRRPDPSALARIAARSMCPTCDDREPEPGEEAYASCFFCAFVPLTASPAVRDGAHT